VHERVAVHLARRGEEEARAVQDAQVEQVARPGRADRQDLERHRREVDGRRGAREVEHRVEAIAVGDLGGIEVVMSCSTSRKPSWPCRCATFAGRPVAKLSTTVTVSPRARRRSVMCEPTNPPPPAIRMLLIERR
jgi:hypothetical protein